MKDSWIHSFCVAKQREMGVSVDPGYNLTLFLEVANCDLQFPTNSDLSFELLFRSGFG